MERQKLIKNAPLEVGDTVICVKMKDDYGVPGGIKGLVKSVTNVFGDNQYNVNWQNGSSLSLIDGVDTWMKVNNKPIEEGVSISKKRFLEESKRSVPQEFVKYSRLYKIGIIKKFLDLLRESSVVNMLSAAQYLYMGKKRIEHEHHYDEMDDDKNEAFQDLLEIADDVRQEIINGAMKHYLQKKDNTKNGDNYEEDNDDAYFKGIERYIRQDSSNILRVWMDMKGGSKMMR